MIYVTYYPAVSTLFLGVTLLFYLRQRRIPDLRNKLFTIMLVCGVVAAVFDYIAAKADPVAAAWPVWALYLVNFLFLASMHACLPCFCFYTLILTGRFSKLSRKGYLLVLSPYLLILTLLLISPFSKFGIFYINEAHVYCRGVTHFLLYTVAALYMIVALFEVFRNRQLIQRRKTRTIYISTLILFTMMLLQVMNPQYLLTTTATALLLTIMYHVLQSPGEHVEPVTGLFNRSALPLLLQDMWEENRSGTLLLFTIRSFSVITHTLGNRGAGLLMRDYANHLSGAFPKKHLFHLRSDVFAVLLEEPAIALSALSTIQQNLPTHWHVLNTGVQMETCVAAIPTRACKSAAECLTVTDYTISELRGTDPPRALLADDSYLARCATRSSMESAIERAVGFGQLQMLYQPVYNNSGRLASLEATAVIRDPDMGEIHSNTFMSVAAQTGAIYHLSELLLGKVCALIRHCNLNAYGIPYVSVPLSAVFCMQSGTAEHILRFMETSQVPPSMICFALEENEAYSTIPAAAETLSKLSDAGFRLMLTDFGGGYADFDSLIRLPLQSVKLDQQLLRQAIESDHQQSLLIGITDLLTKLRLPVICGNVTSQEQAALLKDAGVSEFQGSYYSEPLTETRLCAFLEAGNA